MYWHILIAEFIWACLRACSSKNKLFDQVFFDEESLDECVLDANLTLAPGVLDVLDGTSPPDADFFKQLPTNFLDRWGAYGLLMRKKGCVDILYIGIGTNEYKGVKGRMDEYDSYNSKTFVSTNNSCPSNVRKSLNNGYSIVHKGLLCWAPIPRARDVPRFRVLFYGLEAVFAYGFWALHSKTMDVEIMSCCPWDPEEFTYDGGCSHNPLKDPIKARFDLTADQLDMLREQNSAKFKAAQRDQVRASKARKKAKDPEYYRRESAEYYARKKAEDPEGHKKYYREKYLRHKANGNTEIWYQNRRTRLKTDPVAKAHHKKMDHKHYKKQRAKRIASKEFFCNIYQVACQKQSELDRHMKSERHKKIEANEIAGVVLAYVCDHCPYSHDEYRNFRVHWKKHVDAGEVPDDLTFPEIKLRGEANSKAKAEAIAKAKAEAEAIAKGKGKALTEIDGNANVKGKRKPVAMDEDSDEDIALPKRKHRAVAKDEDSDEWMDEDDDSM